MGGFARYDSFTDKSAKQLGESREAGYENPYFCLGSERNATLALMNKGYTASQTRIELEKLEESGMPYIFNYLCGAGGKGNGVENVRDTAKTLRRIASHYGEHDHAHHSFGYVSVGYGGTWGILKKSQRWGNSARPRSCFAALTARRRL